MPKFYLSLLFVLFVTISPVKAQNTPQIISSAPEQTLIEDKIYFFAHSLSAPCSHAYGYLQANYPNLNIPIIDMKDSHNLELYKQCVKKFNIPNKELKLPLFCLKDDYVMGWTYGSSSALDKAIQRHLENTK
ncbi:MAG: hypothetical protein IKW39_01155 [Alphaproteobacteria bacterium]|nr:hypothetical protein [Alphaproteobacteria bacterium]